MKIKLIDQLVQIVASVPECQKVQKGKQNRLTCVVSILGTGEKAILVIELESRPFPVIGIKGVVPFDFPNVNNDVICLEVNREIPFGKFLYAQDDGVFLFEASNFIPRGDLSQGLITHIIDTTLSAIGFLLWTAGRFLINEAVHEEMAVKWMLN